MNVRSFNITDVAYHYIGLRALAAMPTGGKDDQAKAISRSVLKYARDRALRLMLPEPRGSFESVGEKVCQELLHFELASSELGQGYRLTERGRHCLSLLDAKDHRQLRRLMVQLQLSAYDNLRAVLLQHAKAGGIHQPVVETGRAADREYVRGLLEFACGEAAGRILEAEADTLFTLPAKALENKLREFVLEVTMPALGLSLPLFRSMSDRLLSLRLLNSIRVREDGREWIRTYTPCLFDRAAHSWHSRLDIHLRDGMTLPLYVSEPDMADPSVRAALLSAISESFRQLDAQAGYFDLPEVRDHVCSAMLIPEAAFDEGLNLILDQPSPPLTVGLMYERITGRRKPLVRSREGSQIFNLVRPAT